MNAPISSPMAARHGGASSSAASSTASQSSPSQAFVPPQPPQQARQSGTETFLRDFNLVAEAAKRAQMACLMRDMEGCGLS